MMRANEALPGRRTIDAMPAFDAYRDPTYDDFDHVIDKLEELVDASVRASLATAMVHGPRVLHRFCYGSDDGALIEGRGSWWTHADALAHGLAASRLVEKDKKEAAFQSAMRERLAIKVDWNKMTSVRTLHVPPDVSIRAMTALAASQTDEREGKRYGGGGIQYVL